MSDVVLIRYHEIALKGGNRYQFEKRLCKNIIDVLEKQLRLDIRQKIVRLNGRIILHTTLTPELRSSLNWIFGIANYSAGKIIPSTRENIYNDSLELVGQILARSEKPIRTFSIRCRRSDKLPEFKSSDIERVLGYEIQRKFPELQVDLLNSELTLGIEIRNDHSYLWTEKFKGPGGLPAGANAKVLTLMSGGIDSPVAALQILKRGCTTDFLHFSGEPFVGPEAVSKVKALVHHINRKMPCEGKLMIYPFGKIQEQIALSTKPHLRTILYRRCMMRLASQIARDHYAQCIVTGENIGQVASQTVENLSVIDQASELPILRPLLTWDKEEIVEYAKKAGTYEVSIQKAADCCTLFADRSPILRANPEKVNQVEQSIDLSSLTQSHFQS